MWCRRPRLRWREIGYSTNLQSLYRGKECVRIRNLEIDCRMWMQTMITYNINQLLGLSGLWAADSARSPLRSRSTVFFQVPLPLIRFSGPLRSIKIFRSAHMFWGPSKLAYGNFWSAHFSYAPTVATCHSFCCIQKLIFCRPTAFWTGNQRSQSSCDNITWSQRLSSSAQGRCGR